MTMLYCPMSNAYSNASCSDYGHLVGDVLVYRNPGLHFGDIHKLTAVRVKELDEIVGNAKYAIFFSTKGQRSVANEIANGDFDGDVYWVSINSQVSKFLFHFHCCYCCCLILYIYIYFNLIF